MLRAPALLAIQGYQRFLSPYKGYGCAYRLAYGGTGCSGYAKHAIAQSGMIRAIPQILRRFAACKAAARNLHDTEESKETRKKRKDRWYDQCDVLACCDIRLCGRGKSPGADSASDCTPDCCSL